MNRNRLTFLKFKYIWFLLNSEKWNF
jgi:hypothetical protein